MGKKERIRREPFAYGPTCNAKVGAQVDRICGDKPPPACLQGLVQVFAHHLRDDETITSGSLVHSLISALPAYPHHWIYTALEMQFWRRSDIANKRGLLDEESQRTGLDNSYILDLVKSAATQPDPPPVVFRLPGHNEVILQAPLTAQSYELGGGATLQIRLISGKHPVVALHLPEATGRQEIRIGLNGSEVKIDLIEVGNASNRHLLAASNELHQMTVVALLPDAVAQALAIED